MLPSGILKSKNIEFIDQETMKCMKFDKETKWMYYAKICLPDLLNDILSGKDRLFWCQKWLLFPTGDAPKTSWTECRNPLVNVNKLFLSTVRLEHDISYEAKEIALKEILEGAYS